MHSTMFLCEILLDARFYIILKHFHHQSLSKISTAHWRIRTSSKEKAWKELCSCISHTLRSCWRSLPSAVQWSTLFFSLRRTKPLVLFWRKSQSSLTFPFLSTLRCCPTHAVASSVCLLLSQVRRKRFFWRFWCNNFQCREWKHSHSFSRTEKIETEEKLLYCKTFIAGS